MTAHRQTARAAALLVAAVLTASVSGQSGQQAPASPAVLLVTSTADDGSQGTLRWAIETSNRTPGRYRIEVAPAGPPPHVIALTRALPPVIGPVQIEGTAWARTGEYVALDGSGYLAGPTAQACPGATPGQYGTNVRTTSGPGLQLVDTHGVEISGLEIRRFCIGVLINRASGVLVHDNRIVANRGGAGVMLTGDDGQGHSTGTTTVHNKILRNDFLDNGDGLELTRGAAFNLVSGNTFRSTDANPEPSQGIEILLGNDNVVSRNRFEGYSDGIQINDGHRNEIDANTFTDNTLGLSVTGVDNVIAGNTLFGNAIGVALRASASLARTRVTRNAIHDNGRPVARCQAGGSCDPDLRKGGIVLGVPGPNDAAYVGKRGGGVHPDPASLAHICPDHAPDCHPLPNGGIRPPTLTYAARSGGMLAVEGQVDGEAHARYVVEVFGNTRQGGTEGELFLGDVAVVTDGQGRGAFALSVPPPSAGAAGGPLALATVTATATSAAGATSEFSTPLKASP